MYCQIEDSMGVNVMAFSPIGNKELLILRWLCYSATNDGAPDSQCCFCFPMKFREMDLKWPASLLRLYLNVPSNGVSSNLLCYMLFWIDTCF